MWQCYTRSTETECHLSFAPVSVLTTIPPQSDFLILAHKSATHPGRTVSGILILRKHAAGRNRPQSTSLFCFIQPAARNPNKRVYDPIFVSILMPRKTAACKYHKKQSPVAVFPLFRSSEITPRTKAATESHKRKLHFANGVQLQTSAVNVVNRGK